MRGKKLDPATLAACVRRARDRYVRLHRPGSMATVCATILFEALEKDIERTGQTRPLTTFTRLQLRDAMAEHPSWEGKAFEESSFNTVPEDLGEQLQQFVHEEHVGGARWQFRFLGPTRKFRRDQASKELFLEIDYLMLGVTAPAGQATVSRRPAISWLMAIALVVALIGVLLLLRPHLEKPTASTNTHVQRPVSVAILPFQILDEQQELQFLGMGISDAIITRLSNASQIRVRPTSSILKYDRQRPDPRKAARELESEYLVAGTLQESGGRFRAGVQLIRASDGASVWGRQFDLDRADLLTLEDQIADQIATVLPITVSERERARIGRAVTGDPVAYESYLRGRASLLLLTKESTEAAMREFEEALRRDPRLAQARAGLATASAQMRIRFARPHEVPTWEERAKREATEALRIAPDLAEAHEALAAVYRYTEFDWNGAMEEGARALALNPSLELAHYYRASAAVHLGLPELADREARAGIEINPERATEALRLLGSNALFLGRYQESVRYLEEVAARTEVGDWYLGIAYYNAGQKQKAEALLEKIGGGETTRLRAAAALASILAAEERDAAAMELLRGVETAAQRADHHVAYSAGAAYAQLGRPNDAVRWLARAVDTGFPCLPWFERDPFLDTLRQNGEFKILMERLRSLHADAAARYG